MKGSSTSPPPFGWDEWYASVGGRSIHIAEVDAILHDIKEYQYPKFTGEVNPVQTVFESSQSAADLVKKKALALGADEVGIAEIEAADIYKDRVVNEKYAIVVGQKMLWRNFQEVPSQDSAVECLRIYFSLGEIVIQLAEYIRNLGYACTVEHPIGDSDVLHVPLALKAGFGELGRHGSIIHPKMGPLFRLGSVITDMPLRVDSPIDAGIAAFCDNCKACRRYCPANAIPDERSPEAGKDHLGNDRYKVDTGKCFPYFAKHKYCSICLPVCVYHHKDWAKDFEGFSTKLFPTVQLKTPPAPTDPEVPKHWYPRLNRVLLILFLLAVAIPSIAQDSTWIKSHYYKIERYITARDGIKLFTSMYIPRDSTEKHPILLTRTPYSCAPYGENNWRPWWNRFQREYFKEGYIMVMQDMRGRYMSEGEFHIIPVYIRDKKSKTDIDEAGDTYDAIDWLIKNVPGNNGKVGVVGISYPGFAATEAALSGHPALVAVSPQAPTTDAFMGDDVHHNGAFFLEDTYGFLVQFGIGKPRPAPTPDNAVGIPPFTADAYDFYLRMGALSNMTRVVEKNKIQIWGELMQHPDYDSWWKAHNTRAGLYAVRPAMMEVGGLFDAEDCFGAWNVYQSIEKQSPTTSNRLVIGPWFHGQWAGPDGTHLGNVRFGSNTSVWYQQNREIPFFNYYLKGKGNLDSLPKATVFFTGQNQWHEFKQWPPREVQYTNLYLQAQNQLGFAPPASANDPDEYVSDPAKPVPYNEGIHEDRTREYMIDDQRFAANRTDVLVYKTDTLKEDITIAGPLTAQLKVSISTTDADFVVKLIDVYPDNFEYEPDPAAQRPGYVMNGYEMLVRGDIMRGRYRNSFEIPEAFVPGKVSAVKFTMNDVAHTFRKGHRIMVQIQSSWFPLVDRNPQKMVDIYTCTDQDFQKSAIKIYHDPANASLLVLPVLHELKPGTHDQ